MLPKAKGGLELSCIVMVKFPKSFASSKRFSFFQVWDLIKLADYLTQRKDIDSNRIGITGVSLGGSLKEI